MSHLLFNTGRSRKSGGDIAAIAGAAAPACPQVRDALYRGTMVCDKLPFTAGKSREAIEVTIAGGSVRYSR
ncbi:MAG: hypothetical protein WBE96_09590, partial [Pseudolabrys sp.]